MYEIALTPINCIAVFGLAVVGFIFCRAISLTISDDDDYIEKKHSQS